MKKKILNIIFVFFLTHCGFTPMYSITDSNIKIIIEKIEGQDREINNLILSKLKMYSKNKNATNIFNIKINTTYDKIIISKDAKGNATSYRLETTVNFTVNSNSTNETFSINENFNINKIEDIFEQKKYESTIKNNFATSISEKLIRKLLN